MAKGQLASVIFGAIGGTVIICSAFAAIVWYIMYKHRKGKPPLVDTIPNITDLVPRISPDLMRV